MESPCRLIFTEKPIGLIQLVWKILSVVVLGSFLSQLDATVVNVSLSSLAVELHSSLSSIQWVTSGYLLALTLVLPLNGWLVDRSRGQDPLFMVFLNILHAFLGDVRIRLVGELASSASRVLQGAERRSAGPDDADDEWLVMRESTWRAS